MNEETKTALKVLRDACRCDCANCQFGLSVICPLADYDMLEIKIRKRLYEEKVQALYAIKQKRLKASDPSIYFKAIDAAISLMTGQAADL